tara:strand:+ start:4651 stop:5805 length:1155 start_codon:yes stop_codon:yes gene_type:complete
MKNKIISFSKPSISTDEFLEIKKALQSKWLTTGPQTIRFEKMLKRLFKAKFLTTVSNATSGLDLALRLINRKKGSEILTTSLTWPSAVNMIENNGYKPIFVDVCENTFNLDLLDLKKKISKKTVAILAIHFGGQAYDFHKIKKEIIGRNITIIDDCSHALGTYYKGKHVGNNADFSIFSFHPNKNITTAEGGAIIFKRKNDYLKGLKLKYHGLSKNTYEKTKTKKKKYKHDEVNFPGNKFILSDVQSSIGIAQLKKVKHFLFKRKLLAKRYISHLSKIKYITNLKIEKSFKNRHSWHLFVIKFDIVNLKKNFMEIQKVFENNNIKVGIHYYPLHLHKYYKNKYKIKKSFLPTTNKLTDTFLSLPLYPDLSFNDQSKIIRVLKKI